MVNTIIYNYDPFSLYLYKKGGSIVKGKNGLLRLVLDAAKTSKALRAAKKAEIVTYLAKCENREQEIFDMLTRIANKQASKEEVEIILDLYKNGNISFGKLSEEDTEALEQLINPNTYKRSYSPKNIVKQGYDAFTGLSKKAKITESILAGLGTFLVGGLPPIAKILGFGLGSSANNVFSIKDSAVEGYNNARDINSDILEDSLNIVEALKNNTNNTSIRPGLQNEFNASLNSQ